MRPRHTARTDPRPGALVPVSFRLHPDVLAVLDVAVARRRPDICTRTEALQDAVAVWLMMELDPDEVL